MLIGYVSMFQITKSREVINNPYNARLEAFENKVIRGSILASDGQQLAYTEVDQNGTVVDEWALWDILDPYRNNVLKALDQGAAHFPMCLDIRIMVRPGLRSWVISS